jgi:threonylcarbamoyladenosine tRNA methylthiotransferase MtaB
MPQVPGDVARGRAAALRAAGEARMAARLAGRVGQWADVLVETPGFGHAEDYLPVDLTGAAAGAAVGAVVRVRLATGAPGRLGGVAEERIPA